MSLRERLGSWLGRSRREMVPREVVLDLLANERAATQAIMFGNPSAANFGPGIGNQPTHATLLRENLGIADTATRAIANRVSTLNPLVKVNRTLRDGTVETEILDDHVLKLLLDRPHKNYSRAMLMYLTARWIVTTGEAYWLKVANGFGKPTELHPAPPAQMTPLVYQGVIEGYIAQDGNGKRTELAADTVIRFFFPDPENPMGAEGYLGPQGVTADTLKFAGQHLRKHYERDATPKLALKAGEGATQFTENEKKRFDVEWRKKYSTRLGLDIDTPALIPFGYELVELAMDTKADITPLLEFLRDQNLMGFFTPRSVLGQVVSGDRSSAETNQWVFDRYGVEPIANLIADGITLQLARDFDPKLIVEFHEFVSEDKAFRLEQEKSDLVNKVRSVNQVRSDRELDPVEWGEQPVGSIADQPYDPLAFIDLPPDVPTALGDGSQDQPRIRSPRTREQIRAYFSPKNEWERQIRREKKYVPAFLKSMRTIFRDQLTSVIAKLNDQAPRSRAVSIEQLFDPNEWDRLFEVRAEPIRTAAFTTILEETLTGLGMSDLFIFTDQMKAILREQGAKLVKRANETTRKRIAAQLVEANAEGESVDQIAKRIQGVFSVRRQEARTIARTEVLKASQQAQLTGFETSGVVEQKQWNTNRDPEVRESHAYAAGEIRNLGDPFDLAGEPADAPGIGAGGADLSPGNAINCRCFLTPVISE